MQGLTATHWQSVRFTRLRTSDCEQLTEQGQHARCARARPQTWTFKEFYTQQGAWGSCSSNGQGFICERQHHENCSIAERRVSSLMPHTLCTRWPPRYSLRRITPQAFIGTLA